MTATQIELIRSGEWLPADEQMDNLSPVLQKSNDVCIDLAGVEFIDASSLQILLSLMLHQEKCGVGLKLLHVSPPLRKWFDCAGASTYLQEAWSGNA